MHILDVTSPRRWVVWRSTRVLSDRPAGHASIEGLGTQYETRSRSPQFEVRSPKLEVRSPRFQVGSSQSGAPLPRCLVKYQKRRGETV